jgi:hypothetical protein
VNGRNYLGVVDEPDDDDYAGYETAEQRQERSTSPSAFLMKVPKDTEYPEVIEWEKAQDEYNRTLWRAQHLVQ